MASQKESSTYNRITLDREDGYAVLTLNRPPANALDFATLREIGQALDETESDKGVRAIIITGSGDRMFSAGADITEFSGTSQEEQGRFMAEGCNLFDRIQAFPKSVIAAVNGFALGGGNELAMACDVRIAAGKARFGQPEINLGIIPGWGGIQRLSRLIGRTRAQVMLLTGEMLGPEEARAAGLVTRVVADEELIKEAKALAVKLAGQAPLAIAETKRLANFDIDAPLAESIREGGRSFSNLLQSRDGKEGVAAFLEKRPPQFTGE